MRYNSFNTFNTFDLSALSQLTESEIHGWRSSRGESLNLLCVCVCTDLNRIVSIQKDRVLKI